MFSSKEISDLMRFIDTDVNFTLDLEEMRYVCVLVAARVWGGLARGRHASFCSTVKARTSGSTNCLVPHYLTRIVSVGCWLRQGWLQYLCTWNLELPSGDDRTPLPNR